MKPSKFKYSNFEAMGWELPEGTPKNVLSVENLPVWTDGHQIVSLWKPTFLERLSILVFGRVWVSVLSGDRVFPMNVSGERTYLEETSES